MKTLRLVYYLLILVMILVSGCTLTILRNDGPIADDNTSVLPDPPGKDPGPPLDAAEQARRDEVARFTREVIYHNGTIVQTIQLLPSGDIIDGIDRTTLPPLPYPLPQLPFTPDALPAGVEFPVPDFEQYPELADLVATAAPFQRPDFAEYVKGLTDATSIQDYLDRYTVGGAPLASEHRHVGLISSVKNQGALGYMNQFHPRVEDRSFSLMEFAVGCPALAPGVTPQEVIGIVISVDKLNAIGRGGQPRLHIEVALPDPNGGPDPVYMWDGADGRFTPNPLSRHRPGEIVDVSVLAGRQVEHLMGMFQMPGTGDWWLFFDTDLLGYYPRHMFTMLHAGACGSAHYGEAARNKPKTFTKWPNTEVGSGQPATAGPLLTAYVRKPQYVDPTYWYPVDVQQQQTSKPFADAPPECYTQFLDWNNGYVWVGGLGGYNPSCPAPPP